MLPSKGVATQIDPKLARQIAGDLVADLRIEADALRTPRQGPRRRGRGWDAAAGAVGADRRRRHERDHRPAAARRQAPAAARDGGRPGPADRRRDGHRHRAARHRSTARPRPSRSGQHDAVHPHARAPARRGALHHRRLARRHARGGRTRLVGAARLLRRRRRPPRERRSGRRDRLPAERRSARARRWTSTAMMGGGVCWVDIDNDGWLDLFAVNSYADGDLGYWLAARRHAAQRALPQRERPLHGRQPHVGGGRPAPRQRLRRRRPQRRRLHRLYVTAAGNDALLWNDGKGHFSEGARAAGITAWGWHTGAAVATSTATAGPTSSSSGYADVERSRPARTPASRTTTRASATSSTSTTGNDANGHARFREVGEKLRIDSGTPEHGLGAVFTRRQRRRPSRPLRRERRQPEPALPERPVARVAPRPTRSASASGSRSAPRASASPTRTPGMGIAAADYSGDGRPDLARHELAQAAPRRLPERAARRRQAACSRDARSDIASAFDTSLAGWGVSWVDLDNDTNLDLVLANGAIPVVGLERRARSPCRPSRTSPPTIIPGEFAAATHGARARRGAARSTVVASRPPTSTTTATSTSPSTRSAAS